MLVPSIRISCPLGREPETVQYSCLPVNAFRTAPDPLETFTPGDSRTSSSKLRPFSGSSRICVGSTTVPSDADVVFTSETSAVTVRSSLICPIGNLKSTTTSAPALSLIPVWTTV